MKIGAAVIPAQKNVRINCSLLALLCLSYKPVFLQTDWQSWARRVIRRVIRLHKSFTYRAVLDVAYVVVVCQIFKMVTVDDKIKALF